MRDGLRVSFRRLYGAGPLHLAGHLIAFAVVAFAFDQMFTSGGATQLLVWYLGLVIAHDLIFVPAYTGLDRLTRGLVARLPHRPAGVPMINHVRAPALISALLLIIYGSLISGLAASSYLRVSGHPLGHHFLVNWLLITAGLFIGSGLIYVLRVVRSKASRAQS